MVGLNVIIGRHLRRCLPIHFLAKLLITLRILIIMINLIIKVAIFYKKRILVTKGEEKFKGLDARIRTLAVHKDEANTSKWVQTFPNDLKRPAPNSAKLFNIIGTLTTNPKLVRCRLVAGYKPA